MEVQTVVVNVALKVVKVWFSSHTDAWRFIFGIYLKRKFAKDFTNEKLIVGKGKNQT